MALVKIGKIFWTYEGEYVPSKKYEHMSVVTFNRVDYFSLQDVPVNAYPDTSNSPYWIDIAIKGKDGIDGKNGKSLYELAVENGYTGTLSQYLDHIKGKSTYELAVQEGYPHSLWQWLIDIKGLSAYQIALEEGFTGTRQEWLKSIRGEDGKDGKNGKNIYELALENGFVGTWDEWYKSMKGKDGYTIPISDSLISPDSGVAASSNVAKILNDKIIAITTNIQNIIDNPEDTNVLPFYTRQKFIAKYETIDVLELLNNTAIPTCITVLWATDLIKLQTPNESFAHFLHLNDDASYIVQICYFTQHMTKLCIRRGSKTTFVWSEWLTVELADIEKALAKATEAMFLANANKTDISLLYTSINNLITSIEANRIKIDEVSVVANKALTNANNATTQINNLKTEVQTLVSQGSWHFLASTPNPNPSPFLPNLFIFPAGGTWEYIHVFTVRIDTSSGDTGGTITYSVGISSGSAAGGTQVPLSLSQGGISFSTDFVFCRKVN
jgi:hypothetical protein